MSQVKEPCPECGHDMVFSTDDTVVKCGNCGAQFQLADSSEVPPPPPPPPPPDPFLDLRASARVLGDAASPEAQRVTAATRLMDAMKDGRDFPSDWNLHDLQARCLLVLGRRTGAPAPVDDDEDDPAPAGAGDVATPSERRRGGRPRFKYTPWPAHVSESLGKTREYQWVAKGGIGCPYGPASLSAVIWNAVESAGDGQICIVDIAVEARDRLRLLNRWPARSIIQRITMVVERTCSHPDVGLMERVNAVGDLDAEGSYFRVAAKHRAQVPVPPADMAGEARRRALEARRAASEGERGSQEEDSQSSVRVAEEAVQGR